MRVFLFILSFAFFSCGAGTRTIGGATSKNLIKQVSVETGCPIEKIMLLDKQQSAGNATYALDVCGNRMVYKQVGSVFLEVSKANEMFKQ